MDCKPFESAKGSKLLTKKIKEMKNLSELKKFIEEANQLTEWHQTVFFTFIELNKIKAIETPEGIELTSTTGEKVTIKQ